METGLMSESLVVPSDVEETVTKVVPSHVEETVTEVLTQCEETVTEVLTHLQGQRY